MPICFWNLCHCPDAQPCVEHTGTGCSIVNGTAITSATQVEDALTRAAEVALGNLSGDLQRAEEITRQLEARKVALERERADFERQANAAGSMSERRAVVQRQRAIAERYARLDGELRAVVAEITALGNAAQVSVAPLSAALVIPYSDAAGYCACYSEKVRRLGAINAQITAELATLGAATAAFNGTRATFRPAIPFAAPAILILLLFIIISAGVGYLITALVTACLTAMAVLTLAGTIAAQKSAILQSQVRLYKLWLSYYRVQQIPTCQKAASEGTPY